MLYISSLCLYIKKITFIFRSDVFIFPSASRVLSYHNIRVPCLFLNRLRVHGVPPVVFYLYCSLIRLCVVFLQENVLKVHRLNLALVHETTSMLPSYWHLKELFMRLWLHHYTIFSNTLKCYIKRLSFCFMILLNIVLKK